MQINGRTEEAIMILEQRCAKLEENADRQRRAANIIVHGVREELSALHTLKEIMNLIYSASEVRGKPMRIGYANANRVRPFRVRLASSDHVQQVLVRSNTLKDYEKFRGVYVTRDETREQMAISKQKRFEHGQKRREAGESRDMTMIKRRRYDNEHDMQVHHTQYRQGQLTMDINNEMENAMTVEQVENHLHSLAQQPMQTSNPVKTPEPVSSNAIENPPQLLHTKNYFISGNLNTTPLSSKQQ